MAPLQRLATAVGYTFAAWLFAALLIYAAAAHLPAPWSVPVRCAGLAATFGPVFSLYFRRERPLHPVTAAVVAIGFLALLDLALIARHLPHVYSLYLRFWDWQVPAMTVAGTIYVAGRRRIVPAQVSLKK